MSDTHSDSVLQWRGSKSVKTLLPSRFTPHTHNEQHNFDRKTWKFCILCAHCCGIIPLVEEIKWSDSQMQILPLILSWETIWLSQSRLFGNHLFFYKERVGIICNDKWLWRIIKRLEWSFISVWFFGEQFPPSTVWIPVFRAWWMTHCASAILATGWW